MARLKTFVHVTDKQGASHVFGPSDDVPDWAAERITNPKAWDGEAPAKAADVDPNTPPPRAGKGSSKEAWAKFAAAHDVKLENDATREDYITELERRGVIESEE
jgi:hypothetical protein